MTNCFCFVICTNDDVMCSECQNYIDRLYVPDGYEIDVLTIRDATSLTEAYNAAMEESDAKYKVYLHQDLFIVNRWFLYNVLKIFEADEKIGLIGMVGTDYLPDCGVMWRGERFGLLKSSRGEMGYDERISDGRCFDAVAVDGAIIITSKDIRWREDVFDGFDFYDVSECLEYRKAGFRVVVPSQHCSWCIHDDGYWMNVYNYNRYREKLLTEYDRSLFSLDGKRDRIPPESDAEYVEIIRTVGSLKEELIANEKAFNEAFDKALIREGNEYFIAVGEELIKRAGVENVYMSGNIQMLINITRAVKAEDKMGVISFLRDTDTYEKLKNKYTILEQYLRRIELKYGDSFDEEAFEYIDKKEISAYTISEILFAEKSSYTGRLGILKRLSDYFAEKEDRDRMVQFLAQMKIHESDAT